MEHTIESKGPLGANNYDAVDIDARIPNGESLPVTTQTSSQSSSIIASGQPRACGTHPPSFQSVKLGLLPSRSDLFFFSS